MTQQEFTSLTGVRVDEREFDAIHIVYMASDMDKFDFCNTWCKMNISRVRSAKEQAKRGGQGTGKQKPPVPRHWTRRRAIAAPIRRSCSIRTRTPEQNHIIMTDYELEQICRRSPDCGCDCAHCQAFARWYNSNNR